MGGGGNGVESGGNTTISNSTVQGNIGVGLLLSGTPNVTGNLIDSNRLGLRVQGGVVSGNTITNNDGRLTPNYEGINGRGGGIRSNQGSARIENNQIRNNIALLGGGIYIASDGNVAVTNNTIANNQATNTGGGIKAHLTMRSSATSTISHNTITGNSAPSGGAASLHLYTTGASNAFEYNTVTGNISTASGGGTIYLVDQGNPGTFAYNNIQNNTATYELHLYNSATDPN
ncbi:MAG: right-handed parallel beta-helix repeat-containing protein, partial [Acidimicrobiales bacterium]|nr:right-handed parallel beta-helix repeat-containing protein [Acidimicrobiales bacterium]